MILIKNYGKRLIYIALIVSILFIACSLQTTFAANQTINETSTGGILGGIGNVTAGDTVFLQPGTYNKTGNDTSITINKNITLQGNGSTDSVIADAQGLSRIFSIGNGYNVTFINITFLNAYFAGNGGAIYNNYANTTMTFINCTLAQNNATNGGGIYNAGNLIIKDSNFAGNNATSGGAIYGGITEAIGCNFINNTAATGGAIRFTNANNTMINCNFINNTATNAGGAIYSAANNLTIIDSNFINNSVDNTNTAGSGAGGAIYSAVATNNLNVINSNFTGNVATRNSGAIRSEGANGSVINCNFINNTSIYATAGAIQTIGNNFTIIGSNFVNNSALNNSGGAIYSTIGADFFISNSSFISNTAAADGGAVFTTAPITISGCNFTNNVANRDSGAIHLAGDNSSILGSNFIGNNARDRGGAIYTTASNVIISICNFASNNAGNNGGAIVYSDVCVNGTLSDCNFASNNASTYGGALRSGCSNLNVIRCNFINNNAGTLGGAILNRGNMNASNNTMIGNTAGDNGGSIFNFDNANLTIFDNHMSGNTAGLGQMIYNNGTIGILNLTYLSNSTVKTSKGSNVTVYATLTDDMGNTVTGQDISFYVDGVFIANATSVEGKANTIYLVTQDPVSILPVTGDYAGYDGYSIVLKNGQLLISKIPTDITIDVPKNLKVGQNTTLKSKLTDKDGNPIANATVDFYVDGKKVGSAITDENGIAKLDYTFTKSGNYNVQVKYAGNETYEASNANGQTTVSKIKTNLELKTDNETITATLTDEDGNPLPNKKITIKVNGKTFTRTNDINGQVTIKFPNANKYKVTAKFAGDDQYAPSSAMVPGESEPNEPTSAVSVSGKATMKETGIPIILALLVLIANICLFIRKKV